MAPLGLNVLKKTLSCIKNPHGSYLKKKIPVELDLVHHGGESAKGDFAYISPYRKNDAPYVGVRNDG